MGFVAVYINIFINRAGHIHKIIKPIAISMDPYSNPASYVVGIIFSVLVLKLFLEEAAELGRNMKTLGFRTGISSYFNSFKNAVDWASLAYSIVIFAMWADWCHQVSRLGDFLASGDAKISGNWAGSNDIYTASNPEFWEAVDATARGSLTFQIILAFFPVVIGLRFFSAFSSQPRLGLVTATLSAAFTDLLHFGVVMLTMVMILCSSAQILFGTEVLEYETFGRTFISVFRALIGDFDYLALVEIGRFPASLWWLAVMILLQMVMLNMLLAIIMDVYGSVKGAMGDDMENYPTLWSQSYEILRRWKQKRMKKRMSLDSILDLLQQDSNTNGTWDSKARGDEDKLITIYGFVALVPGLSRTQAERLLGGATDYANLEAHQTEYELVVDTDTRLRAIDLRLQQWQDIVSAWIKRLM